MATLTIKNMPDELYEMLKKAAAGNRRSINNEVITIIEKALQQQRFTKEEFLEQARQLREMTAHYYLTNEELDRWKNEGRP